VVRPITKITVTPNLPTELERLRDLAYNLRWSWDHDTIDLFLRLDRPLWIQTDRNPVEMLGLISQERLQEVMTDPAFMNQLDRVWQKFEDYMNDPNTWYKTTYGTVDAPYIAYFSMEFGLTTCLKNYSGGLGVLSGDHMKSASDCDLPLVGVGLLYQEGYFAQYLNKSGFQQESYPINDYPNLPVIPVMEDNGERMTVTVPIAGTKELTAYVWKVQVGRVPLYLMDANHPANEGNLRDVTDRLYGGDRRKRIRQEILLGIGGMRLLEKLNVMPEVVHMNEGHSALLALERTRLFMETHTDLDFWQAKDILATGSVYTIHTPVPAGLERFGFDLIDENLEWLWEALGLTRDQFHDLGREEMGDYDLFSLPVMALQFASGSNGVSQLHGEVSRTMWQWMFPDVPEDEVPVQAVTNGVHVQSWVSKDMGVVLDRYLDPSWRSAPDDPNTWTDVENIPDAELWRAHERRRERLISFTRDRLHNQLINRGFTQAEAEHADFVLNPEALTIGFARRFATYKRATLILSDIERLIRLVNNHERPVQLIFAGKAHPHDVPGKEFIQQIVEAAAMPELRNNIVFLENYDMTVGRYMVQGVDVWLNTPRRPKEASGTSGMKVIYNGGLNVSILDGWWAEGYDPTLGWAIGGGEQYPPEEAEMQDEIEARALYDILESEVIPTFYMRGRDGLPRDWIRMVKNSMMELAPFFSTYRMLKEYTDRYYVPAHNRYANLTKPDLKPGIEYAAWLETFKSQWDSVKVLDVETTEPNLHVGGELAVKATIELGTLKPSDVTVQLYSGTLNSKGEITNGTAQNMSKTKGKSGKYTFEGSMIYDRSGDHGVSVRVLPNNKNLADPFLTGYIRWAE